MKRKKVLFVIHRLGAGGAEKALVSLLNTFPCENYDVELMVGSEGGVFRRDVPSCVKQTLLPNRLRAVFAKIKELNNDKNKGLTFFDKIFKLLVTIYIKIFHFNFKYALCQLQWKVAKAYIPENPEQYDVAVSFMHGYCNYYVIDKVKASKKILWVHNDYNMLNYSNNMEAVYYEKSDYVATISNECVKALVENFPELKDKFVCVENISSVELINKRKNEILSDTFFCDKRIKFVSVGRLSTQKGFDLAIEAARKLKDEGVDFGWYILGEGSLRESLQMMINNSGLSNNVFLLGVKENPYPYINAADLFVMPSRFEGKSVVLEEAKILSKPIVVTKYPTVGDAIVNEHNGLLVNIDSDSIFNGILCLLKNESLRDKLICNLKKECKSNEDRVLTFFLNMI